MGYLELRTQTTIILMVILLRVDDRAQLILDEAYPCLVQVVSR